MVIKGVYIKSALLWWSDGQEYIYIYMNIDILWWSDGQWCIYINSVLLWWSGGQGCVYEQCFIVVEWWSRVYIYEQCFILVEWWQGCIYIYIYIYMNSAYCGGVMVKESVYTNSALLWCSDGQRCVYISRVLYCGGCSSVYIYQQCFVEVEWWSKVFIRLRWRDTKTIYFIHCRGGVIAVKSGSECGPVNWLEGCHSLTFIFRS